jgi:hypothetical protein
VASIERAAPGLSFEQLHARVGGFAWTLVCALNDELRRGRLRLDGDRFALVPEAFPPELLDALRALAPDGFGSARESNGRRPVLPPESPGKVATCFPEVHGRGLGAIAGRRGAVR